MMRVSVSRGLGVQAQSFPLGRGHGVKRAGQIAELEGKLILYSSLMETRGRGGVGEARAVAQRRCFAVSLFSSNEHSISSKGTDLGS